MQQPESQLTTSKERLKDSAAMGGLGPLRFRHAFTRRAGLVGLALSRRSSQRAPRSAIKRLCPSPMLNP